MDESNWNQNLWPNGAPADWGKQDDSNTSVDTSLTVLAPPNNNSPANLTYCNTLQPNNYPTSRLGYQQPLARTDTVQKRYLEEEAYTEIVSTPAGLYVQGKSGRLHCVFPKQFLRCICVTPDIRYHGAICYYIYFSGKDEPLKISEKDFGVPKKLSRALSQHFNTPVKRFDSQAKTDALLQTFFASETQPVDIHYYFGWIFEENLWKHCLWNGKTHAISSGDIPDIVEALMSDRNFDQNQASASAELVAVSQTIDMMCAIHNSGIRGVLWVLLHMAALFKLLDGMDFRIPMGVCLSSNETRSLMAIEPLLTWFDDASIQLTAEKSSFCQLIKERSDQPLGVWDAPSQVNNSQLMIQSVRTGNIEPAYKNSDVYLKLMAMPFVLSTGNTTLSFSPDFIPIEISSDDLAVDACNMFSSNCCYFEDYLNNFMRYVEKDQGTLPGFLQKRMSELISRSEDNALSSREHLVMLAIFRSVRQMMAQYMDDLSPSEILRDKIDELLSEDSEQLLIAALQQTSRYQDDDSTVEAVFFAMANQKLLANDFDVRKIGDENINDPCAPNKQGIVFYDQTMAGFTTEAFRAVCAQTGYSTRQVSQALLRTNAYAGNSLNTSAYLSKLHGITLQTKKDYVAVHKFAAARLALPQPPRPKLKAPSECDFTLQLGTDINGVPMVWNGTKNSHIKITGSTGTGKSYFMKKMISQLPAQNAKCIIFDAAGDFSRSEDGNPPGWPPEGTEIINIANGYTQINPFVPLSVEETNEMIATRILDMLSPMLKLGVIQESLLRKSIQSGLDNQYISSLADLSAAMKISDLPSEITGKVDSLCDRLPHGNTPLEWNLDKPGITILNIHNYYSNGTIRILLEMLLSIIYSIRVSAPKRIYRPVVLVLDECQLLDWGQFACIKNILSQGRKYGLAAWLGTQYIADKEVMLAIGQADLHIYFQPTKQEARIIARDLAVGRKMREQQQIALRTLKRGQFICNLDDQVCLSAPPV